MVAGVTNRLWEIEDLLALLDQGAAANQLMDELRPCRKTFRAFLEMIKFL